MESRIITRREPQYYKCPVCDNEGTLYRSHTKNIVERLIRSSSLYNIYRCHSCNWRGYLLTVSLNIKPLTHPSKRKIINYTFITGFCILIVIILLKSIVK